MLGSVTAGGPALHGHRFDRYWLVVFEAVLQEKEIPLQVLANLASVVIGETGYLANLASVG